MVLCVVSNDQGLQTNEYLRHHSGVKGDPLTDIVTLTSARCLDVGILVAGGSWALQFPPPNKIKFVAVLKGNCWLTIDGEFPLDVKTGDVFVLPAERAFVMAGDLNAAQTDGLEVFSGATDKIGRVGNGDDFFAVGAHIALDPERGRLLSEVLPPLIHLENNSPEASAIRWLLEQLVKEVADDRLGALLASRQLAQLLCVHIIRSCLETSGPETAGWLRALNDERCTCSAPPTPGAGMGLASGGVGKGSRHVANEFRSALQVDCRCGATHLSNELADAVCRAGAA